jgi:hypothetical protein
VDNTYAGVLAGRETQPEEGQSIHLIAISAGTMPVKRTNLVRDSEGYWRQDHGKRWQDLPNEYVYHPRTTTPCYNGHVHMNGLVLDKEYPLKGIYEFYDALWVEWDEGIAYRKGLARIAKDVYERETLGWVDITMG